MPETLTQQAVIAELPLHLRPFAKLQEGEHYTPRDHAVWRYTMHQLVERLNKSAHAAYEEGLRKTGISLEHIPSMEEMNARLADLGWRAVVVDGFIPPAIFMEFQARRVLPIALDMRSIDHILYTPAPDIVHESAGHAPLIADPEYAAFLQRFGEIGMKVISTKEDYAVYEAIRHLSIVKEAPGSRAEDIRAAELELQRRIAANTKPSEATLLSRLHWWTVEYGLLGTVDNYQLFGAGLLSSLGESVNCLDNRRVKKLPLTVDAIDWDYDITTEQPQLFVARNWSHLMQVLEQFAERMCYRRGGADALRTAIASGAVCTAEYSSGVQLSGRFCLLECDALGNPVYVGTSGPSQLACGGRELPGQGIDTHPGGIGSPVGQLVGLPRCLSTLSSDELAAQGIVAGQRVQLDFVSGIRVTGTLLDILRADGRNLVFSFDNCSVRDRNGKALFDPPWGRYFMAVGERVASVYGGVADRETYQLYGEAPEETTIRHRHSSRECRLFTLYLQLREMRESGAPDLAQMTRLYQTLKRDHPREWLLRLELLELLEQVEPPSQDAGDMKNALIGELHELQQRSPELRRLIGYGLHEAVMAA